jgi:hypothetical protein
VISNSTVIPKVSSTQSLIPRAAVVWMKSESLWTLCISHMWMVFQRSSNAYGTDTTSGQSSKQTLLGVHSWKPGPKEIRYRRHSASYSIPCECGRSYIGETSRPLAVRLREHRHNLHQGLLEKSCLRRGS